ncbi:hypothetical protein [Providencia rettgeri]|nr:hypothetical protein [Providencia rettgeri]NIH07124.1 hypothetical protein [Providencia rettgeri]
MQNPLISDSLGKEVTFVLDNNAPATFDGGYEKKSGNLGSAWKTENILR